MGQGEKRPGSLTFFQHNIFIFPKSGSLWIYQRMLAAAEKRQEKRTARAEQNVAVSKGCNEDAVVREAGVGSSDAAHSQSGV